ncbi:hypothetical protein JYK00_07665 [Thermosipho ferrireducens]|uniref:Uncharacterized protein n=1 Tax=Thermosipho ferrireducens TaxID=2571116 RepID=A0ABX7S736_9BACT|nr:hypothetical protein [Thermosipho ferrireducens]QTA37600.1 hypothetical protein JYK00_07665 [Thermosipho ferrireducens]
MRKTFFLFCAILLIIMPYLIYLSSLSYTFYDIKNLEHMLRNELKLYFMLIESIVNLKKPSGYVIEQESIYYKGNLYNVKVNEEEINFVEINNEKMLIYVKDGKWYKIPDFSGNFIIYNYQGIIITDKFFGEKIENLFSLTKTIQKGFFEGKRVLLKRISLQKNLQAVIIKALPIQHVLLYFFFVPLSLILIYDGFIYKRKLEREFKKKSEKLSKALLIVKEILTNLEDKEKMLEGVRKIKRVLKGE